MAKTRERADGKRSFTVYAREKKGAKEKFTPTGAVMHSAGPSSAAKKAGYDLCKQTGKSETEVYIREAGIHNRVRKYTVKMVPYGIIDVPPDSVIAQRMKEEELKADDPIMIAINAKFQKRKDTTNARWVEKYSTPEFLAQLNAEIIDGVMQFLPGKHKVMRGMTGQAKYVEVIKLPEDTPMSANPAPEPAKKPAGGATRGRKKKNPDNPVPVPAETPTEPILTE